MPLQAKSLVNLISASLPVSLLLPGHLVAADAESSRVILENLQNKFVSDPLSVRSILGEDRCQVKPSPKLEFRHEKPPLNISLAFIEHANRNKKAEAGFEST